MICQSLEIRPDKKQEEEENLPILEGEPLVIALARRLYHLAGHRLLSRERLVVDDPDGYERVYQAKERVHGTAMASLDLPRQTWMKVTGRPSNKAGVCPGRSCNPSAASTANFVERPFQIGVLGCGFGAPCGAATCIEVKEVNLLPLPVCAW
jgi:hypothetical protein